LEGGFRDVDGVIADPFEVVVDFQGREDKAEVRCHRLLQGQEIYDGPVVPGFKRIDLHVTIDHRSGESGIAALEGPDSARDPFFRERSHLDDVRFQ
jgi:hypothetical protein